MRTFAYIVAAILALVVLIFGLHTIWPIVSIIWSFMDGRATVLFIGATVFGLCRLAWSATELRSVRRTNAAGVTSTVQERDLAVDEDDNLIGPTMTGLREWLGAYNVLHVYFLFQLGQAAYYSLNLDPSIVDAYGRGLGPNWDKFIVCFLALVSYGLIGFFGRWRDNALTAGQPWSFIAIVQGMFMVFFLFMPYVNVNPENLGWAADSWQMKALGMIPFGWYSASNPSFMAQVMFLHLGAWAAYIFGAHFFDRGVRYVSFYWATRCAFGGVIMWWGMHFSDMTRGVIVDSWLGNLVGNELLAGISSTVWVVLTVAVVIVSLGWKIARDMKNSDQDWWYTAVSVPGVFKMFAAGGNLHHCIMNVSGVPMAAVDLPLLPGLLWVLTRNYGAMWQWMLIDLERRGNPRYFGRSTMWVGPGFAYPGIPYYTTVMELVVSMWELFKKNPIINQLGNRYGTLLPIGDWDLKKGPHSTGRIGLVVTIDFRWRCINPFEMWTHDSWRSQIDNAADRLTAGLVRVRRFGLFGESGPIRQLADYRAEIPADDNHPAIPERLENPAVRAEDNIFVRAIGEQTGGLADERDLQAVTTPDVAVQEFLTGDVSTHMMSRRMEDIGMDADEVQELIKRVTIARSLKGIDGGALALVGLGGLFGAGGPPAGGPPAGGRRFRGGPRGGGRGGPPAGGGGGGTP